MIIKNYPIDVRHFFQMVKGWINFSLRTRHQITPQSRINFLYFSYSPDFEFLHLSIRSLIKNIDKELLGKIFIAEDQKSPFTEAQKKSLYDLCSTLTIVPIFNFAWGSAQSTYEEGKLFFELCSNLNDEDILAKVDSDVLFFNDQKLKRICWSGIHAVGDPHFLQYKYAQGGLYLMRVSFIKKVVNFIDVSDIERVNHINNSVGEDKAFTTLFKERGRPFCFTRLMLFPDEYGAITELSDAVRREFVALHFHKDKNSMEDLAKRLKIL